MESSAGEHCLDNGAASGMVGETGFVVLREALWRYGVDCLEGTQRDGISLGVMARQARGRIYHGRLYST